MGVDVNVVVVVVVNLEVGDVFMRVCVSEGHLCTMYIVMSGVVLYCVKLHSHTLHCLPATPALHVRRPILSVATDLFPHLTPVTP